MPNTERVLTKWQLSWLLLHLPQFCLLLFEMAVGISSRLFFPQPPTPSIMAQSLHFLTKWSVSEDLTKRTDLCCSKRLDSSESWTRGVRYWEELWKEMGKLSPGNLLEYIYIWSWPTRSHAGLCDLSLDGLYKPRTAQGHVMRPAGSARDALCGIDQCPNLLLFIA